MIDLDAVFKVVDYRLELDDATDEHKRQFLKGLDVVCHKDTPALNELRDWLTSTLEPEAVEPPKRSDREVVERRNLAGGCYQLEKVKCGKENCKCSKGKPHEPHGPYWYFYRRTNGKLSSKYIGKKTPPELLESGNLEASRT